MKGKKIETIWNKVRVIITTGDITEQKVDAIVNSANPSLMGGGGVDGAIHRRGGPSILAECKKIRKNYPDGLPRGKAVVTNAGKLKAKYVIHTVGPVWEGGNKEEAKILSDCYVNSLLLAKQIGARSIAFPSISTGAYGYPVEDASKVALRTVKEFVEIEEFEGEIVFVLFSQKDMETYVSSFRLIEEKS